MVNQRRRRVYKYKFGASKIRGEIKINWKVLFTP